MSLHIKPLDTVGVEVEGFDIHQPLDEATRAGLVSLWNEHGLLLFRGQNITPEKQIAFSRSFGPLEVHPLKTTIHTEHPELFTLENDPEKDKYNMASWVARPSSAASTGTSTCTTRAGRTAARCCARWSAPARTA